MSGVFSIDFPGNLKKGRFATYLLKNLLEQVDQQANAQA